MVKANQLLFITKTDRWNHPPDPENRAGRRRFRNQWIVDDDSKCRPVCQSGGIAPSGESHVNLDPAFRSFHHAIGRIFLFVFHLRKSASSADSPFFLSTDFCYPQITPIDADYAEGKTGAPSSLLDTEPKEKAKRKRVGCTISVLRIRLSKKGSGLTPRLRRHMVVPFETFVAIRQGKGSPE
ncbi:MAG: hypothetical protein ACOZF0_22250 [Thermodesulfobacteriota bacterium]